MAAEPARGAVVSTGELVSARRAGPGWIAVFGGNAAQREALLRSLRTTP
ncbi:hypothetical protein DVA67_000355 [Solirubrobacter sp. CPCC 204708]|nr:hypothetical protein [Solirubrobacter deserti]